MKVGFHFLAQEMFSTQGLDLRLLHCRGILVAVIIFWVEGLRDWRSGLKLVSEGS